MVAFLLVLGNLFYVFQTLLAIFQTWRLIFPTSPLFFPTSPSKSQTEPPNHTHSRYKVREFEEKTESGRIFLGRFSRIFINSSPLDI